jgi:hypothetical protein
MAASTRRKIGGEANESRMGRQREWFWELMAGAPTRAPPLSMAIGCWRHAESGSIKRLRVGAEAAEANLRAVLKDVYAQAGVKTVRAASCGVASATMPGITEWITAVFNDFCVERSEVVGDHIIALDAAFHGGPGNPADRRNRHQHHRPRARRQPGIRRRLELAPRRRRLRLLDRRARHSPRAQCLRSRRADADSEKSRRDLGHAHPGELINVATALPRPISPRSRPPSTSSPKPVTRSPSAFAPGRG